MRRNLYSLIMAVVMLVLAPLQIKADTVTVTDLLTVYDKMYAALQDKEGIADADRDMIVSQYFRLLRYDDSNWTTVGGKINPNAPQYLAQFDEELKAFTDADLQLGNGDLVDLVHMMAVINGLFKKHGDIAGWAGDLVTYSLEYTTTDFPGGSFSMADYNADLDAYNLYQIYSNSRSLGTPWTMSKCISEYYDKAYATREVYFVTGLTMRERYENSKEKTSLALLVKNVGTKAAEVKNAADKMQAYIDAKLKEYEQGGGEGGDDDEPAVMTLTIGDMAIGQVDELIPFEVSLANSKAISAMQFDIQVPAGVTLSTEDDEAMYSDRLSRNHSIAIVETEPGIYKVTLLAGLNNTEITGSEGVIMTLFLTAAEEMGNEAEIKISNQVYSDADGKSYEGTNPEFTVRLSMTEDLITGIKTVAAPAAAARYNVAGQQTSAKGLVIINGKKYIQK